MARWAMSIHLVINFRTPRATALPFPDEGKSRGITNNAFRAGEGYLKQSLGSGG